MPSPLPGCSFLTSSASAACGPVEGGTDGSIAKMRAIRSAVVDAACGHSIAGLACSPWAERGSALAACGKAVSMDAAYREASSYGRDEAIAGVGAETDRAAVGEVIRSDAPANTGALPAWVARAAATAAGTNGSGARIGDAEASTGCDAEARGIAPFSGEDCLFTVGAKEGRGSDSDGRPSRSSSRGRAFQGWARPSTETWAAWADAPTRGAQGLSEWRVAWALVSATRGVGSSDGLDVAFCAGGR